VQVICSKGEASGGRPEVDPETIGDCDGGCVKDFHKYCRNQTLGKIYTKQRQNKKTHVHSTNLRPLCLDVVN
jgi:hypothetical protein